MSPNRSIHSAGLFRVPNERFNSTDVCARFFLFSSSCAHRETLLRSFSPTNNHLSGRSSVTNAFVSSFCASSEDEQLVLMDLNELSVHIKTSTVTESGKKEVRACMAREKTNRGGVCGVSYPRVSYSREDAALAWLWHAPAHVPKTVPGGVVRFKHWMFETTSFLQYSRKRQHCVPTPRTPHCRF